MNRDAIAFALVVAGALCAECIPLASALIGAAWVVKFADKKEAVSGADNTRDGHKGQRTLTRSLCFQSITFGEDVKHGTVGKHR